MDHRIFIKEYIKDQITERDVECKSDNSDTGDFKLNAGSNISLNCNKTAKVSKQEKYKITHSSDYDYTPVPRMSPLDFLYKDGMEILVYKSKRDANNQPTVGDCLGKYTPQRNKALIVLKNGTFKTSKNEVEESKDAFIYDSPEGEKNTYVRDNVDGEEYMSNNKDIIHFFVANSMSSEVFVQLRQGDEKKLVLPSKRKIFQRNETEGVQIFEKKNNPSNTEETKYAPLCRTRYPKSNTSLIITKEGYVTESWGTVEYRNDAWIDIRKRNHYNISQNDSELEDE